MKKILFFLYLFLLSSVLKSQNIEGVYELELIDIKGKVISRATAFQLNKYIATSFHFINSQLLIAERIRIRGSNNELKIVEYDELNDILLLSSDNREGLPFELGSPCAGETDIIGYYKGVQFVLSNGKFNDTGIRGVKRISQYLRNGFSGAPVVDGDSNVCGMVVLSSENNVSSVIVTSRLLKPLLVKANSSVALLSLANLRKRLGVEKDIYSQADLNNLLRERRDTNINTQIIVNIKFDDQDSKIKFSDASNIIIRAKILIGKIYINRSNNIMLHDLRPDRLIINKSDGVTVDGCSFKNNLAGILVRESSNLLFSNNKFEKINNAIIVKNMKTSTGISLRDNHFDSVKRKLLSLDVDL